jgi:hypothetical protein
VIEPENGFIIPKMHFSKVVFPEPFGPQKIILFPSGKSREKLLITRLLLYPAKRLEIFIPKKQKKLPQKKRKLPSWHIL